MAEGKAKRKYLIFTMEEGKRLPRIPMRSWTFVIVIGSLLALMSIIDRGGMTLAPIAPFTPVQSDCSVIVTSTTLNVRTEPVVTAPQVQLLDHGVHVAATTVLTGGFRELSDGHWALDQFLTPVPGSHCS